MTGTRGEEAPAPLVAGAHRVIRMLDAHEGPYGGALVTWGEGVAVRIDARTLSGWEGWRHAGSEHVAGPVDLIRRADGHDVLLPWCRERVVAFLSRRRAGGLQLAVGEANTLVMSLLRGVGELSTFGGMACEGTWWLTEEGRPTFVIGAGEDARAGAVQIVSQLEQECRDRAYGRALAMVREGLQQRRDRPRMPLPLLARWEGELCELAAPRPLRREAEEATGTETTSAEQFVRSPARGALAVEKPTAASSPRRRLPDARLLSGLLTMLVPFVRVQRQRLVRETARVRAWIFARRARPEPPVRDGAGTAQPPAPRRRRRSLIVTGGVAALVLVAGLAWPTAQRAEQAGHAEPSVAVSPEPSDTDGEQADAEEAGAERSTGSRSVVSTPGSGDTAQVTTDNGPLAAVEALIDRIRDCRRVQEGPCDAFDADAEGVLEKIGVTGALTYRMIDEYGDVAVIRATPQEPGGDGVGGAMLVLVRRDGEWLVRDAYDVADQPSL